MPSNVALPNENSDKAIVMGKLSAPTSADMRVRRDLIATTIEAFNNTYPVYMRWAVNFLQEITKVQTRGWRKGYGELKLQLPQELFLTLRRVFQRILPDEPSFGDLESDIDYLTDIAPKLMPPIGGARARRGKRSR